jgi:hypothetical protein
VGCGDREQQQHQRGPGDEPDRVVSWRHRRCR